MLKREFFIGLFVGLLFLGLSGNVFAAGPGSEAGVDVTSSVQAVNAAQSTVYDQEHLAAIGTEAGEMGLDVGSTDTKADMAAASHEYDLRTMELIGTEAGVPSLSGPDCNC